MLSLPAGGTQITKLYVSSTAGGGKVEAQAMAASMPSSSPTSLKPEAQVAEPKPREVVKDSRVLKAPLLSRHDSYDGSDGGGGGGGGGGGCVGGDGGGGGGGSIGGDGGGGGGEGESEGGGLSAGECGEGGGREGGGGHEGDGGREGEGGRGASSGG